MKMIPEKHIVLSIVIPCYNEEKTLEMCIERVVVIGTEELPIEIIIVDDHSTDQSYYLACELAERYDCITVLKHTINRGKGAALRTGFSQAKGDFVAVQDADLEYDPQDLKLLIRPLLEDKADVVFGSRFLSAGEHRVLYFWHYLGNRFLTFLSNMFTDINLTDMETCYKVFRREIIQSIKIEEERFGFEPEIVSKVAHMRVRIFERGISYFGRTYAEGKKIGVRDGFRALYCIFRYNAPRAPIPIQLFLYLFIGGLAALINIGVFALLTSVAIPVSIAAAISFVVAAIGNYILCILILFRHRARWKTATEIMIYALVVLVAGVIDVTITSFAVSQNTPLIEAKIIATVTVFLLNFLGRRFFVFPEPALGPWKPQSAESDIVKARQN
jgi:glycosyltransferase involved in cell wall biosynthesis